eukprot:m.180988 g.180988  ORF g.180988 m.180988 type:complete len:2129 (+) comp13581_c0_seq3:61-6447(+)
MEPTIPVRATERLKVTRKRFSFAAKAPPPSFIKKTIKANKNRDDDYYYEIDAPAQTNFGTAEMMLNRGGTLPSYDPLSDPHLADYFARKFTSSQPQQHSRRIRTEHGGPATRQRRPKSKSSTTTLKKKKKKKESGPIYTVNLFTSKSSSKISKSEKYIKLYGTKDHSKKLLLASPGVYFKAGSKVSFQVQLHKKIGKLEKILLENVEERERDAWHVTKVVIRRETSPHSKYTFHVANWFSRFHGDGRLKRTVRLGATGHESSGPTTMSLPTSQTFDITLMTGDKLGAGTDANVFVSLTGVDGSSPRMQLKNDSKNPFEREANDKFVVTTPFLSTLTACTIEHDNKGLGAAWYLDRVIVKDRATDETFVFPCMSWLSKKNGLKKELTVAENATGMTDWVVSVMTGKRRGAGTDANVHIVLIGDHRELGPFELRTSRNDFERGKTDRFTIHAPKLLSLDRIRIFHDNSGAGPGWFLDSVNVVDTTSSMEYNFPCQRWLAKDEDDGRISRELRTTGTSGCPYRVHITTGNKMNAATSANVYCIITGESGTTGKVPLENHSKNFTQNRTDIFPIDSPSLGSLMSIEVGHDNKGIGAGWFVEQIILESILQGKMYTIPCKTWFATSEEDRKIVRKFDLDESMVQLIRQKTLWQCSIYTSDLRNAGTDANVFLQIFGTEGKTDELSLRSFSNTFERGDMDHFEVELPDIGLFTKARVWHDNKGIAAGWHLDHIEMADSYGTTYLFQCGRWLAKSEDDHEIIRELPAQGSLIADPLPLLKYEVHVFTGAVSGAGTDASVHINIFGKNGDTGLRNLSKSSTYRNKFERSHEDVFVLEAVSLSDLSKILIGHNNKGLNASWFLDKVEITDPSTGNTYTFPCERWLSTKEDDGQIQRILPVLGANDVTLATTTYIIRVSTGDKSGAGTDSGVYITLFGEDGDSGKLFLRRSETYTNKFERKHTDVFRFELVDIGNLSRVIIGHDNSNLGAAWFLDKVVVEVPSNGKGFTFPCNRWLSKKDDDRKTERELYLDESQDIEREVESNLVVRIATSDVRFAGTDAKVFVVLYGEEGKTGEIYLTNKSNNFERGKVEEFKISAKEVGRIEKLRIGHDNKGMGSDWHLEKVELHDLKLNVIYTCVFDCWIKKEKGSKIVSMEKPVSLLETIEDGHRKVLEEIDVSASMVHYEVSVQTSDISGAGTDSNVYIIIYGDKHDSGERSLSKSSTHRNKFERSNVDVFDVEAVELGEIQRIRIWHDSWGVGAAWHLDRVTIKDPIRDEEKLFICDQWLSKKHGDKQTSRELGAVNELPEELQHKAITFSYKVSVHTADVRYAGTDANVWIRIYGAEGDTGEIKLEKSLTYTNKWERNHIDEFVLNALDLGDLTKIRIGHDGKGAGAGWCLDKVVIDAPLSGKTWTFNCGEWLDSKSGDGSLERTLTPESGEIKEYEAKVPWEVIVRTSDIRGAGTDAKVFMEVYGRKDDGEVKSDRHEFPTEKRLFETGSHDRFNIELADVGEPFKLRVGHDNRGLFAAWHCEGITLINQTTSHAYEFPINKWFQKGKETKILYEVPIQEVKAAVDGDVIKSDAAVSLDNITYTIHVFTGDVNKAGTDANVFVNMHGEFGDTGEVKLAKSKTYRDKFERNHEDIFEHTCVDLGNIQKVDVWHDSKGLLSSPSWFLDRIEVESNDGRMFKFICQKWLSKKHEDKQTKRVLMAWVDPSIAQAKAENKLEELMDMEESLEMSVEKARLVGKKLSKKEKKALKEEVEEVKAAREEAEKAQKDALVAMQAQGTETIEYSLTIETKDDSDGGTTAPVFVEIFGEKKKRSNVNGNGDGDGDDGNSIEDCEFGFRDDFDMTVTETPVTEETVDVTDDMDDIERRKEKRLMMLEREDGVESASNKFQLVSQTDVEAMQSQFEKDGVVLRGLDNKSEEARKSAILENAVIITTGSSKRSSARVIKKDSRLAQLLEKDLQAAEENMHDLSIMEEDGADSIQGNNCQSPSKPKPSTRPTASIEVRGYCCYLAERVARLVVEKETLSESDVAAVVESWNTLSAEEQEQFVDDALKWDKEYLFAIKSLKYSHPDPCTPYMHFGIYIRSPLARALANASGTHLASVMFDCWNNLPLQAQAPFEDLADRDYERTL